MKETVDLLIKLRCKVDIAPEQPFLFALGGNNLRHIRGHDAIKKNGVRKQIYSRPS